MKHICCSTKRRRSYWRKIEQVVRLVRSKGVGVYFVTQNPLDIPDTVLGQLGNRIQHACVPTPRDQKRSTPPPKRFVKTPSSGSGRHHQLGVGEALVSFLSMRGRPSIVERAYVCPPKSQIGLISGAAHGIAGFIACGGAIRKGRGPRVRIRKAQGPARRCGLTFDGGQYRPGRHPRQRSGCQAANKRRAAAQGVVEAAVKGAARAMASEAGRRIIRGCWGRSWAGRK